MLGIDTNVLVRLIVADDAEQTRRARKLIDQARERNEAVLVSLLVLMEAEWVLRSGYGFEKSAILQVFSSMTETRELSFEDEAALEMALFLWTDSPCGFSDCLISARNLQLGCRATASFDAKAVRLRGVVPVGM